VRTERNSADVGDDATDVDLMLSDDDVLETLTPFGFESLPNNNLATPDILNNVGLGLLDFSANEFEESVDLQTLFVSSTVCN